MPSRVLVVAYNFPPVGGVGVQRTLKFVTHLPRYGWEPVVLTARDPGVTPHDDESVKRLDPALVVERAYSPEPVKLRRALGGVLRHRRSAGSTAAAAPAGAAPTPARMAAPAHAGRLGLAGRIWTSLIRFTFFPDEQAGWIPFAARLGGKVHRERGFDAVYSSSGPVSSHMAAWRIARRAKVPWVADFRDPWIGNAFAAPLPRWQKWLQARVECAMARRAAAVVVVTDGMREQFESRYPWARGRVTVIHNGYDRNDLPAELRDRPFAPAPATPPVYSAERPYRLLYAGTVYGEHELEIFLDGLELLLARRPELRDVVRVEFVGWLNRQNEAVAALHDTPERLAGIVAYTGFVPHDQAVAKMAAADALFNVIADEPDKWRISSGKLTEYLGLDRQIVAFVPEGAAREILRSVDWGIVADPTPDGVADGIERAIATPVPARRADPEGRYDRVNLAGELAAMLDRVTAVDAPGS
jgi:glycosyltransferase involved in cell wall biosynthesis